MKIFLFNSRKMKSGSNGLKNDQPLKQQYQLVVFSSVGH